ncbi:MAG: DUF1223 domain-containing protein [Pseudomonadota bacterium]
MGIKSILAGCLLGVAMFAAPTAFGDSAETMPNPAPVLVELFTSQSCSSCPPAEALFADLAERDDLVVIEWHVDYWDELVHGRAGKWKDPYSDADYTRRQRDYNLALRGMGSVYTPQAVINGQSETTGSRRGAIAQLIEAQPPAPAVITMEDGNVTIAETTLPADISADVLLVSLLAEQTTDVRGGENQGRTLMSRNVAVSAKVLGQWSGPAVSFDLSSMGPEQHCALIVQDTENLQVLGARYCSTG